ncbi:eCIS core domain-containing protein [Streptomyces sp. NPDC003943]
MSQREHHPDRTTSTRQPAPRVQSSLDETGFHTLQRSAGNAAVLHLLQLSGYPFAQPSTGEQHRHGAGCGHTQAGPPAVQRSAVHDVLKGNGRPLDTPVRDEMEARLGADFSDVRIHDDSAARASATEVGARAYTSGAHIVIGDGGNDRHTLAHELTHVLQQRQGPVAGTDNGAGLKVSDPSDRFEREAEANAIRVMSGQAPDVQRATTARAAREPGGADRSAPVQRAPGGGHSQGDHVFNALGATGEAVADAINAAMKNFLKNADGGVKTITRPAKGEPGTANYRPAGALFQNSSNRLQNVVTRVNRLRAAATAADASGHPSDTTVAHYSFIATLPTVGGQADDANSTTYGDFSRRLVQLAETVGDVAPPYAETAGTWAIPAEYIAGAGAWSTFLESKIFDDDARARVLAERVGNRTAAFEQWLTASRTAYAALYANIIAALQEARSLVLWVDGMQRNTYYDEGEPDYAAHAGAVPDLLAPPGNGGAGGA